MSPDFRRTASALEAHLRHGTPVPEDLPTGEPTGLLEPLKSRRLHTADRLVLRVCALVAALYGCLWLFDALPGAGA